MKTKMLFLLALVTILAVGLTGSASAQAEVVDNIVDVVATDGRFDTAYDAIVAAGLEDTLASADETFTVFVPRDSAFNRLSAANPAALDFLLADPDGALTDVLLYHVIPGQLSSADIASVESLATAQGGTLDVRVNDDGEIFINDARVIEADIPAKNGVIHVIADVLVPEDVELPKAPARADRDETSGSDLDTIIGVLEADGRFTTLLDALEDADLAESLASAGDYTLFAPTDDAFDALDIELTDAQLRAILRYHVVGDSLTRDQLATDDLVPTQFSGRPIFVNRDGSNIRNLSGARVDTFNVPASNGIIHILDGVMIP